MKLNKMLKDAIRQSSGETSKVAVAVVAGLAVGAALAVLFAPEKGGDVRSRINDTFGSLKRRILNEEEMKAQPVSRPMMNHHHAAVKKPKSDIKELIHEAHQPHTEQGL